MALKDWMMECVIVAASVSLGNTPHALGPVTRRYAVILVCRLSWTLEAVRVYSAVVAPCVS